MPIRDIRTFLEINRQAIKTNLGKISSSVKPLALMAVLKADAYGMGLENIAPIVKEYGIEHVAVIELSQAQKLINDFKYVHLLGSLPDSEIELAIKDGIIIPVDSLATAIKVDQIAKAKNIIAKIEIEIDTGMGRLGIPYQNAISDLKEILKLSSLKLSGVYSHFPSSDQDLDFSLLQIGRFKEILKFFETENIDPGFVHIANSGAIQVLKEACISPFNLVRTGIAIYGESDSENVNPLQLQNAIQFKAKLIAVRELPAGFSIGYAKTHILTKTTLVGTVSAGYADGVPFGMGNQGKMYVRSKACNVIGRVSMDFCTIDLSNCLDAKVSDEVSIVCEHQPLRDLAKLKNSIVYDVLCAFPSRVKRVLV